MPMQPPGTGRLQTILSALQGGQSAPPGPPKKKPPMKGKKKVAKKKPPLPTAAPSAGMPW